MLKNIFFIVTISLFASTFASFCHWNSGCPYKYFASKTSYNAIRGDIRDSLVILKGCEPVSIWGLLRHGKRYPSTRFGKSMNEALAIRDNILASYEKGRSSLCAQDIEDLNAWVADKKMFDAAAELTPEGYEEMFGIGKRIRHTFNDLLEKLDKYTFRPAFGKWIEDSAKAFVKGFNNDKLHIEKALPESDVMAPYLTCGKYQKDVQKNPNIYAESEKYKRTSEYLATKDRIQRRTGIDYELTDTNVTALYDLCRHTWSGVESKLSPWCALFTKDDLQVLEYIQDLRSYYRNGYGTAQSEIFGQIPLADLLRSFQKVKEGDGKKMTAYFTHATMLDMVYTSLGLFKDNKPLSSANRDRDRKWRSSANSAFSVNLVAVLNRCTKNDEIDYNVVFYLNEEPIRAICADGTCTWKEFEEKLTPFLNTKIDFCEFKSEPY
ncbi:multiple inositol polyphosphate phosphatase 1-like isoform X1 [Papilio machaon]|uniref:multiple inositol polyphosphate phosphatase 1-like isoform X1 n=1 Tax=Papilio machaon TaxID=76193 RepID=UPI001E664C03|nr:multiple inositol polyphosphate phosphatase 1-like isoform X1 [Papilio machaon]